MAMDWLTLLGLCLCVASSWALEIPNHNCSLFTYRQMPSGQWIGLFQAPKVGIYEFHWSIIFHTQPHDQGIKTVFRRPLMAFPSEHKSLANIRNGGRAQFYVALEEFQNRLPMLWEVKLNTKVLCSNETDDPSLDAIFINNHWIDPLHGSTTTEPAERRTTTTAVPSEAENQPRIRSDFDACGQEGFVATQHGGSLVTRGQYPWLATLLEGESSVTYKCVVSVISKRTVITAAHCIYGKSPSQLWVHLGRHDRNQNPENGAELVGVSNVLTPPQYTGNPLPDSDVGLLVLQHPIWYTRYIQPLCLWSSELPVPAREGDSGTVAGWGYDESGLKTRYPKAVSVRLVPRDQCLMKMKRAQDFITERTVCAGNPESHGPCFGDSGAGLIVLRNNRWVLRGIVSISPSRGENCDLSNYVLYCDVSTHLDWIHQNIVM